MTGHLLSATLPTMAHPLFDTARALARRHGFDPAQVEPMASTGVVNTVFALGTVAVLRIPGDHPDAERDAYTEKVAVPAVRAAGVPTPELLVFDDTHALVDGPVTIYARVTGHDLGTWLPADDTAPFTGLGRALAHLHASVTDVPDPYGRLDTQDRLPTADTAHMLEHAGVFGRRELAGLEEWWARLAPRLATDPAADGYRRFVHGDVKTSNVMAREGRFAAFLDWGDAGFGDPAHDLMSMPLRAADAVLAGYRQVMPMDGDDTVEARVVWTTLVKGAWSLMRDRDPREHGSGSGRPGSRLVDLATFLLSDRGGVWRDRCGL